MRKAAQAQVGPLSGTRAAKAGVDFGPSPAGGEAEQTRESASCGARAVEALARAADGAGALRTLCGLKEGQARLEKVGCALACPDAFLLASRQISDKEV